MSDRTLSLSFLGVYPVLSMSSFGLILIGIFDIAELIIISSIIF